MAFDTSAARRDLPILAELQQANSNEKAWEPEIATKARGTRFMSCILCLSSSSCTGIANEIFKVCGTLSEVSVVTHDLLSSSLTFSWQHPQCAHNVESWDTRKIWKIQNKSKRMKRLRRNVWASVGVSCCLETPSALAARRDDHIAAAANDGDLAAVRGHPCRDRRCLDQLFSSSTALHWAALRDHTAIVAFLEKGDDRRVVAEC
eukprot:s982_g6.t1